MSISPILLLDFPLFEAPTQSHSKVSIHLQLTSNLKFKLSSLFCLTFYPEEYIEAQNLSKKTVQIPSMGKYGLKTFEFSKTRRNFSSMI